MRYKFMIIFFALLLGVFASCFAAAKSVYFDGTGDYITLGANKTQAGMNGATGLTLETWVNPSSLRTGTNRNVIADFCISGASSMVMMYFTDSGKLRFGGRSRSADNFQDIQTASAVVSSGYWYHLAGVLDFTNDTVKLYLNGELIGSKTTGVSFGSDTYVSSSGSTEIIGCNQPLTATQYFHGYMDDMRIWSTPRTQAQIQYDMTITLATPSNLLGYWKFDDNANDSSGSGYTGTLMGDTAYSSTLFHFGKYYRSIDTGTWRDISNWEVSLDNSDWVAATVYPIAEVNTYIRTGDDITMGANARCKNLIMNGGTLTISTYALNITGTLTETSGTISGKPNILGYASSANKRLAIAESGVMVSGFSAATSVVSNMPQKIDREWTLNGTFTGNKSVTFYWNAADDDSYSWGSRVPSVYDGATEYTQTAYNVSTYPHWVTVSLPSFGTDNTYTIGRDDEEALPVELSSFTVALSAYNNVTLQWITQSETNVSGFRIYRSVEANFETAEMLSQFVEATNTSQMQVYMVTDNEIYDDGTYYYWLESADMDGSSELHGPISVNVALTNSQPTPEIPIKQGIISAYPNPFNPTVNISYILEKQAKTEISVFNQRGQLVRSLLSTELKNGQHNLMWNGKDNAGKDCSSGIYLFVMETGGKRFTKRATLMK
ncbi:MAG: FlgD immunoglobulin-like domain containing protein [Candidatus Cloacimonetes bacterium]|nr:FlgD immunoglobulin-like domain containing protein [Candidatus Cloacimonadota bacterium]